MGIHDGQLPDAFMVSLRLDEQLCFALYATSRAVTAAYRPFLDDMGITYPQYLVLMVLWERGAVPMKELGASLHLDYGTLSPLIKRLAAAGLIARARRSDDERSVLVTPTERGLELQVKAACMVTAVFEHLALSLDDAGELRHRLERLAQGLG
jgi:DNA-binding MarR family transcriptional regulator